MTTSLPCLTVPQKCISKEELCGQKPLCEDASDVSLYHAGCSGEGEQFLCGERRDDLMTIMLVVIVMDEDEGDDDIIGNLFSWCL